MGHDRNNGSAVTIRFSTAGVWAALIGGGAAQTGPTALLNAWQAIDFRADLRGGTYTLDWMVDGVAQTQAVSAAGQPATTMTDLSFVNSGANTINIWFDDMQIAAQLNPYPLADQVAAPITNLITLTCSTNVSSTL